MTITVDDGLRLLLVDDHTVVRAGLRHILERASERWSIDEACSGFQALEILRQHDMDVVIVDLAMPGMSGLDLIRRIKSEHPHVAVLVLSMHAEEQYAMRSFKAGANGYLTKESAADDLVHAVCRLAVGGAYVSSGMAERVVLQLNGGRSSAPHERLTDRELDVLRRIVGGQRLTEIAQDLHLSVKTVSTHKSRVQEKLDLHSTAALVRYGLEQRLLEGATVVDATADGNA